MMKATKRFFAVMCSLLLALSLTAAQAATPTLARFSMNDLAVSYVYGNQTREDAQWMFGEPADIRYAVSEATGEQKELWQYDGMTLTFTSAGALIGAEVSTDAYTGPRGVRVGQTAEDVTALFYRDPAPQSDTVLYTSGYVEAIDAQLPPCGVMYKNDDGSFSILYAAPAQPFGDEVAADPTNYIYEELASLSITFDADARVTGFSWSLGPWAE